MRRFEFVEGTSAKFWMADAEGSTFTVVYGRLGTDGQRKEKAFPTEDAARRELEKKIAEKLREGYHEVAAGAVAAVPTGAKGAAAAAPKLALPPRVSGRAPTVTALSAAVAALVALEAEIGGRSWRVAHAARKARRALEALGGVDPAAHPALSAALDALVKLVLAPAGARRLPLRIALELLSELDAAAFTRALGAWSAVPASAPAAKALAALTAHARALEDSELALRVSAMLADGAAADAAWQKRWRALAPHVESYLAARGSSLKKHLAALATPADPRVAKRAAAMAA